LVGFQAQALPSLTGFGCEQPNLENVADDAWRLDGIRITDIRL
jgi:hypothetical protein